MNYDTGTGCDIAEDDKAKEILSNFNARNEELDDGRGLDGWDRFCHWEELAPYRYIALGKSDAPNKEELFAHYLDCEEYTDVWRHLFKTRNHTNEIQ